MSRLPLSVISVLCSVVSVLLIVGAAPSRRGPAAVVSAAFLAAASAAALAAWRATPVPMGEPIGSLIPDPDAFLQSVTRRTQAFHAWAASKDCPVNDELEALELMCAFGEEFLDSEDLLTGIAAYGELLRREMQGEWMVSRTRRGRELVVARRRRPWTRRRVIYEVADALSR